MEENTQNNSFGGVLIGTISLIENLIKASLSIIVLVIGIPYVFVVKDKIHAEIYVLLSLFGLLCSVLLINGAKTNQSGKIIWWICFQGVSIFHQIFFSADVIFTLYQRVVSNYIITICVFVGIVLLLYIFLEIYFMHFVVQFYQQIAENEIENSVHRSVASSTTPTTRDSSSHIGERTDRNNPMQSSIIKLLTQLEANSPPDTVPLLN